MATQFRPRPGAHQLAAIDEKRHADGKDGEFWLSGEVRFWQVPLDDETSVTVQSPIVKLWLPQTREFSVVAFTDRGRILGSTIGAWKESLSELRRQIES